jgi:hypothetical protein
MKGMVDVCQGKMTIGEVINNLIHYMAKSPKKLVIEINRREGKNGGYYTTFYITIKDFNTKC